jgi:hypothetical protein
MLIVSLLKMEKIKYVVKLPLNDKRYKVLENIFKFNKIEEKVYDDYEVDTSYILGLSIYENKKYSIIYDSLNDSRYVHFCEFLHFFIFQTPILYTNIINNYSVNSHLYM